jgi:tRNA A-37 threonylcarbamoyl transferase component Bud32
MHSLDYHPLNSSLSLNSFSTENSSCKEKSPKADSSINNPSENLEKKRYTKILYISSIPVKQCIKKVDLQSLSNIKKFFPFNCPSSKSVESSNKNSLECSMQDQQAKIERLIKLKVPLEQESLNQIYNWLKDKKELLFDKPNFSYPALFEGAVSVPFRNQQGEQLITETKIFLEVHSKSRILLLFFDHPQTQIEKGCFKRVIKAYALIKPKIKAYAFTQMSETCPLDTTLLNEEKFLKKFYQHKSVVKTHAIFYYTDSEQTILMKYYPSNLFNFLSSLLNEELMLSNQTKQDISIALLEILVSIHAKGVIHRDIKPDNILIKSNNYVLTDWGFACTQDNQAELRKTRGSPTYCAPEILMNKTISYGAPADIWAMGCIFLHLWKQINHPWDTWEPEYPQQKEQRKTILNQMNDYNKNLTGEGIDRLLKGMLRFIPEERYTAKQALDLLKSLNLTSAS